MDEQYNTNQSSTVINQEPSSDDRLMGTLIYVLSFFTSLIAPLIIWLIKREDSPFIDKTGKNYFNFLLSYMIWLIVASIAMFIIIGFILFPIIAILNFIFTIVAAVKAYNGEDYLPPLSIRFFK
ncbi:MULTISPECIES: DUF4870 domain-containing protein [Staphylococcus]|uniref:DUF4870 domain-containing protein n=6 Tax=Staphylococcus equorum TaxID=246432 RepID=A0AAP7IEF7_9STAP|nr:MULTISPECIES: DUF4870 domain-containing protein [Staphylococcus]ALM57749.1 hypothetical protein SE1039_19660 [Staphylococcus equorum]ANK39255.1 hypothetical protein AOB58_2453 [Staphylococcus sp. AntiMn-1]ANR68783.1 hypothetical protein AWC34_09575 [Staphylococcus equorum]EJX18759.1 hypothetical protein SOJ_09370 [Staphylococcus sp. OJ82]ERH36267.1 hypothetical protein SEQU_00560 [Staphylococcus equorum UMC-CNS-924]